MACLTACGVYVCVCVCVCVCVWGGQTVAVAAPCSASGQELSLGVEGGRARTPGLRRRGMMARPQAVRRGPAGAAARGRCRWLGRGLPSSHASKTATRFCCALSSRLTVFLQVPHHFSRGETCCRNAPHPCAAHLALE